MDNHILINITFNETRVALIEGGQVVEIYIERQSQPRTVGNIYKGKVSKIIPGIQAAFIDIGLDRSGFISAEDVTEEFFMEFLLEATEDDRRKPRGVPPIQDMLRDGQEMLVQVIKEPVGSKGAKLSSNLAIPGKYLVLLGRVTSVGISRRIEDPRERRRLSATINAHKAPDVGFIARTASEGIGDEDIAADMRYLTSVWEDLKHRAGKRRAPCLLYQEPSLYIRALRDLVTASVNKVIVDCSCAYSDITSYLDEHFKGVATEVSLYEDPKPLFERYNIEQELGKIREKKVWLKSGGYLIIDHAEALTVVDVNSGRYAKGVTQEDTIFAINTEAAKEIAHQIRLRNLVGIIVIDFIDMREFSKRGEVLDEFTNALRNDRAKSSVLNMSDFGVVQMTRQRVRESLLTQIAEPCSCCGGTGLVKSLDTLKYEALRSIKIEAMSQKGGTLVVRAGPELAQALEAEESSLKKLEGFSGVDIVLEPDSTLSPDHFTMSARGAR